MSPASRVRSLPEALAALRAPLAPEAFSSLTGESLLVVDMTAGGDVPGASDAIAVSVPGSGSRNSGH